MKPSAIDWTDYSGADLNFVTGCTPVSAGCLNCYARAIYQRFGKDFGTVQVHPDKLERLLMARFPGPYKRSGSIRPLCFVCDTGDLFHPSVPAAFITKAFDVMGAREDVDWIVLTKRPERAESVLLDAEGDWYLGDNGYLPNIWLGVTAENQEMAERRIPLLLRMWRGVRWVSVEPCLESIELRHLYLDHSISWLVVGAESGPNRRPFNIEWAESLYWQCQCQRPQVAFFGKQASGLRPGEPLLIGGRVLHEWPEGPIP